VTVSIACSSVTAASWERGASDGHCFREASDVSPVLAALLYTCSSTAVFELCSDADESVKLDNCGDRTLLDGRMEHILRSLDMDCNTAASYIRFVMNVCMDRMRMKTVGMSFIERQQHRCCEYLDGVEVSLRLVGSFVRKYQRKVDLLLEKIVWYQTSLRIPKRGFCSG